MNRRTVDTFIKAFAYYGYTEDEIARMLAKSIECGDADIEEIEQIAYYLGYDIEEMIEEEL